MQLRIASIFAFISLAGAFAGREWAFARLLLRLLLFAVLIPMPVSQFWLRKVVSQHTP